ncbi:MAG: L,D-transpeptidase family protein [Acidobacteriales bacterium]|nr:L,D-transpeptidase family protein [Terriglobales bacterium]
MQLMAGKDVVKTYKIALGTQPVGAKQKQGDRKTPEGNYVINGKNPNSQFHRSLRISYPNAADRERARKLKVDPGGDIMIHGIGKQYGWLRAMHRQTDWTWGCIAVTNEEVEEIWKLVPIGRPIEIRP